MNTLSFLKPTTNVHVLTAKTSTAKTSNVKEKEDTKQISIFDWMLFCEENSKLYSEKIKEQIIELVSRNYRLKDRDFIFSGTAEKIRCNIEAIKTLKKIEKENRNATTEEQAILARYIGWGGLAQIFQNWKNDYKDQREELKNILTEDEYESARASTPNAHYTPPDVIKFVYDALIRMGFKKGRIIEPSMGTGFFFGLMPEDVIKKSKLTGVEIDTISGRIAKQLYPDADIRVMGFEEIKIPDDFFDVAVSNVPFGDYEIHDPRYNKYRASIHDYFFLKAIDIVRPGGIVAFITSRFTMDKKNSRIRKALHEKADLIAAIRLPNTAFKAIANTEVVTDIIFLKKRAAGSVPIENAWLETITNYMPSSGNEYHINEYFVKNPEMILGIIGFKKGIYGNDEFTVNPDGDLIEKLGSILRLLPEGIFTDIKREKKQQKEQIIQAPDYLKEGAFTVENGKIYRNISGSLVPHEAPASIAKRIEGMVQIRDTVRALLHDEIRTSEDEPCNTRRAHLNMLYDNFIKKHGYINNRENKIAFCEDPDYPLLLSLEIYDPDSKTATKADIFSKRVVHPVKKIEKVDTAKEAFLVSLNELGKIDFNRMSELTGKTEEEILSELEGLVFKNPNGGHWETADEYLSGNVREKLKTAEIAAMIDEEFKKNVEALKSVQPKDLDFTEIYANLGASWIPASDIKEFVAELLDVHSWRKHDIEIDFSNIIGTWTIEIKGSSKYYINDKIENTKKWGTSRYSAIELIEAGLNHKIPTVYDTIEDNKRIVNVKETEAAREKLYLIKERFREWIWQDQERRERLVKLYNEMFNSFRIRHFDGSHLTLPGISLNAAFKPHQKDVIWRIIQTGNTLIGHVVGAGKSWVKIAAAMEMKRLGLVTKPLITVPNHLLEQFTAEFLRLYPLANVLSANKDDFTPKERKTLMAKIATGNWDAVIVTHSSFEKIPVSKELSVEHIQDQIKELEDAIMQSDSKKSKTVKNLEKAKKRLEVKIKNRLREEAKDDGVTFEELGIDMLIVDEADMFKNLFFVTKMPRIAGLPNAESNRAFDLFVKVNYLNKRKCPVIFATGTPVSNTMAELYTMQQYLQPDTIKQYGIAHFDAWSHNFGEIVTAFEIAPDGSGYRLRTRFARFINLPELMSIFRKVADIRTTDMIDVERPQIKGGKPVTITVPASEELKRYIESLVVRSEAIRAGRVNPQEDNMLCVSTDGRKAALDMRLVGGKGTEYSKVNKAVQKVFEIWERTKDTKSTQLVFCDISTPKPDQFNVYYDFRDKLIMCGIPQNEIAFIHDADTDQKKKALFDKVNNGIVRVLMGSTEKMGTGVNVQKRLIALHHLDAPWRPRDIEQREGRILRQGNMNKEVEIYRYVTEGSFDAYMWQTLESKARFIAQVMTGEVAARTADDIEGAVLTYAEVKALASGNPIIIEKFKIDTEVRRLETLKAQHISEKYRMQSEISCLPSRIENLKIKIEQYEKDIAVRNISPEFSMVIDGVVYTDRKSAGARIISKALGLRRFEAYQEIGSYAGFALYIKTSGCAHVVPSIVARGNAEHVGNISDSDIGTIQSLDYAIKNIEEKISEMKSIVAEHENKLAVLQAEIDKPFQYEEKLRELVLRQEQINKQLGLDKDNAIGETEEEMAKAA